MADKHGGFGLDRPVTRRLGAILLGDWMTDPIEAAARAICDWQEPGRYEAMANQSPYSSSFFILHQIHFQKMARAAVEAYHAAAPSEWQPIETAPKDGRDILLFNLAWSMSFGEWQIGWWKEDCWNFQSEMNLDVLEDEDTDTWQPTHWMSLPEPPK